MTRAIYPHGTPSTWGGWSWGARNDWSRALERYKVAVLTKAGSYRRWEKNSLTLAGSWEVLLAVAPNPDRWWELPGVTWADFAARLAVSRWAASYRFKSLGWELLGAGGAVPGRRVVWAPCVDCGDVWASEKIVERKGPCCRGLTGQSGRRRRRRRHGPHQSRAA